MLRLNPILASLLAVLMIATTGLASQAQAGVPKSYTEAMEWYRQGAEAGDPKAQFYLGLALEQGAQGRRDLGAARAWFKRAADGGHAVAWFKLAVMRQSGQGGAVDLQGARRAYEQAAGLDVAEAQYNLAVMLQDGSGGPPDPAGAAELFETTARGGNGIALLHLAVLSTRDEPADTVEAMKWALLADRARVDGAAAYVTALAPLLSVEQREQAEERARDWK